MGSKKSFVNTYLQSSIAVISLLVFLATALIYTNGQKQINMQYNAFLQEYTDFRKAAIKDTVGIVLSLIDAKITETIGANENDIFRTKKEILEWINTIRLKESQYIVVNTMNGTILAHFKPQNIGKNMWDFQDPNGVKAVQDLTRVSQLKDGGFVRYIGSIHPASQKPGRKITYAKSVPEWGWVVATGFYLDDIEQAALYKKMALKQSHQGNFLNIAIVLVVALLLFYIFAKAISGRIEENFLRLTDFFHSAASKASRIDPGILHFSEFQNLALPVNEMVETTKTVNDQLLRHQQDLQKEVRKQTDKFKQEVEKYKKIQEELQESEATLKSVFKAAPVGIGMVVDRTITQANSRFCEMIGYERDDLLGQSARILYPSDEEFAFVGREKYRQISQMGTGTVETRWQQKTGEIIDVLLSSTPLNQEAWSEGVTFTALDITERKLSIQALKKSEEKFRNIFETLMDVYFETTLDGIIKNVSPSALDISGYTPSELIGTQVDLLYNNPADRGLLLGELKQYGRVRGFQLPFRKKGGEGYDVSINADFYFNKAGKPAGLIGTIRDVTRQKRLEEKLQRSKKMESLGLMAGGIAHDLNNILSGLVSYPELLLLDIPKDSPRRRPVEVIRESGRRASDIVSDLLTIAKGVAAGKDVLNLNNIVNEYFDSAEYRQLSQNHASVAFKRELDPDLLNIRCSSPHMKKVLMNLVANAAEAIERNGEVAIQTTNRYLDKPLRGYEDIQIGEYVLLRITDSGTGISHSDLERIFEPFYTKKMMGRSGTGLGLAVVWNTVQDHDGYINVESSRMGTIFELYFPVTRDTITPDVEPVLLTDYRGNREKILIVDDEENQRNIACDLLKRLNYSVESVSSGEAAIIYLQAHQVDLIVLDMIMLPGMNGQETFEKAKAIDPDLKAIIASGFAETQEVKAAQELGAGDYIKKPYTLEKIGIAIRDELKK